MGMPPTMRAVASITLAAALLFAAAFTAPASGKARHDATERAIVAIVNDHRAAHGVPALERSKGLARAADFHSWEMLDADYFSHDSRDGSDFSSRVRRYADHRTLGETIARLGNCGGNARQVVQMWMDSAPHRDILLSSAFDSIGVGKRTGSLGGAQACMVTADLGS